MAEPASRPRIIPMPVIGALLAVGLASSLAFRAIIVADHLAPGWVRPLWYTAVLLNAAFFCYRYWVSRRRFRAVAGSDLDGKLYRGATLTDDEREQAAAILHSVRISPERWNYLVIFFLSAAAIVTDLVLAG